MPSPQTLTAAFLINQSAATLDKTSSALVLAILSLSPEEYQDLTRYMSHGSFLRLDQ